MELARWAGAEARPGEPIAARRSRNRVSGIFLGTGAALTMIVIVAVPGWHITHLPLLAAITGVLLAGAVYQVIFAADVPIAANHAATIIGTAAIAAAQCLIGDPVATATLGMLYVWIAICAALYYSAWATAIHVADLLIAQVAVLVVLFDPAMVPQVILTAGTSATVAAIITVLVRNMRRQAITDPLTRLLNRRGLQRILPGEIAIATKTARPLTVAIVDLDGFKQLNDTHGHAAGDAILTAAAHAWQQTLRPGDTIARLGGDEFAILLPGCSEPAADRLIPRLLAATPEIVTCSAGAAIFDGHETNHDLLARADAALYRAKMHNGTKLVIDHPPVSARPAA